MDVRGIALKQRLHLRVEGVAGQAEAQADAADEAVGRCQHVRDGQGGEARVGRWKGSVGS